MITVYTKTICPYCHKAKKYLDQLGLEYTEINVEEQPSGKDWLMLEGHRTVPQIYYGSTLLVEGGCDGLMQMSKDQITDRITLVEGTNFDDFKL